MYLTSYKCGIIGEYVVCIVLIFKGYFILARRYKTHFGEVDIIAKKGDNLVGVEVKLRKNKDLAIESVRYSQIRRIKNSLNLFVENNKKYSNLNIRIDILLVSFNNLPRHIINVF